ncbi:nitroreductase family protein [Wenyingzhuangia sp. IMCC45467]
MSIKNIISKRRTLKVLSNESLPINNNEITITELQEIITYAGKAPFHYPANKEVLEHSKLKSIAPWRFYILNTETCRDLAKYYTNNNIDGGKIIQMLYSTSALIMATWIPEPDENNNIEFNQKNIEHVAATSAAIQNILLIATEKDYETYWSSGGSLRNDALKTVLNIPLNEQLLASIFIFNKDNIKKTKQITGAWRDQQGDIKDFSSFVTI